MIAQNLLDAGPCVTTASRTAPSGAGAPATGEELGVPDTRTVGSRSAIGSPQPATSKIAMTAVASSDRRAA